MNTKKFLAMKEGGKKLGSILSSLLVESKPGVSLLTIEKHAQEQIKKLGGKPSFQTVSGYYWATCLCINDEVVHGIPKAYILKENDLFTIDIGMIYKGYHTDTAYTIKIKDQRSKIKDTMDDFLDTGEKALQEAIAQARIGNRIGHISRAIQKRIKGAGYSIVKCLVGHGVGKSLHEEPQIPGYMRGSIDNTPLLLEGMTIAIEVIYAEGKGNVITDMSDGWTMRTRDHSRSAVFEHSIYIDQNGPYVLTVRE
jgi:methionyl aminopeptidase